MSQYRRPARPSAALAPSTPPRAWNGLPAALLAACLAACLHGPAWAQYKVVGPDGSVTYTDRAPTEAGVKVQPMRRDGSLPAPTGAATAAAAPAAATTSPTTSPTTSASTTVAGNAAAAAQAALPFQLRGVVARFPVTLYSTADCAPCASARSLLLQRGVPFTERSVASDDDIAALQRLTGGRSLPALTIGAQALRGLQEGEWQSLLDLAGYPRDSRLPRGWSPAPARPLVAANSAPSGPSRPGGSDSISITGAPPLSAVDSAPPAPAAASPAASAGIRF